MKPEEIKNLLINSLSAGDEPDNVRSKLDTADLSYSFSPGFTDKVIDRLFPAGKVINREVEFIRSWNLAFYRIALTGAAAIVILLISIYLNEGSFSINTLLGVSNGSDESIVSLLTGN